MDGLEDDGYYLNDDLEGDDYCEDDHTDEGYCDDILDDSGCCGDDLNNNNNNKDFLHGTIPCIIQAHNASQYTVSNSQ